MTQTITNGTGRKSLANEIDRLQATVAGLGEGLRDAVRQATTQAVRETVTELVSEVLTNPDVAALFRNAQAQAAQAPRAVSYPAPGERLPVDLQFFRVCEVSQGHPPGTAGCCHRIKTREGWAD